MELILIKTYKHLELFKHTWGEILSDNDNTNPFVEFEFVYNWWKFFGEGKQIEIQAVKENNRIIAFFPFQLIKKWFGYSVHFIGVGDANYMDIVARKRDLDRVIMFVFDAFINRNKSVVFHLHGLLESGGTPSKISAYLKARSKKEHYSRIVTPYINLENLNYEEYMKSRHKLHGMDRREKRLRLLGEVVLGDSPPKMMARIFEVHKKRWEKKNDTSGFSSKRKKAFFQYLAEQETGELNVRLTTLSLKEQIIAFTYGFSCRGRYLGYVLGHDSDFDVYGPGRILIKEKISSLIEAGFHKLDMSIGYEPYKFEWNTDLDYTRRVIFSTNNFRAKRYRDYLRAKDMLFAKIRKNYSIVLFRRNTIGKLKYYMRNQEKLPVRLIIWWRTLLPIFYTHRKYVIARLDNKVIQLSNPYMRVTSENVLDKKNRKDMLQKIYNGYKGYYTENIEKAFWVNENVIRIDDIQFVKNLEKKSVYIRDWEKEELVETLSMVQNIYKPKSIYVHVEKNDKNKMKQLESLGFQFTERLTFSRRLGKEKLLKEELT